VSDGPSRLWLDFEPCPPRVALVTGASSGIGRAIAIRLGRLGWAVGIGARRADRLAQTAAEVEAAGGRVCAARLDIRDPRSVERFVEAIERELGVVDVLVNNAGITHTALVEDTDPAEVRDVLDANLVGSFDVTRRVVRSWRRGQRTGDVIFISSSAAVDRPWPYKVTYGMAKTGLDALARGLQSELEGSGIRVTIVRVGAVRSEIGSGLDPLVAQAAVARWQADGVLRTFEFLPVEQVAYVVALVATAPKEMLLREVFVEAVPPAEPLSSQAMDAGSGRASET
jgi:NAD(P)-dependent dehydrogenase (short-subunit alcohol dehydrogenase family)